MSPVKSVCVIDDDKVYTYGIKKIINNHLPGNEVIVFENGKEAMDAIIAMEKKGKNLPDMILLDINMPEMNGWEFLNEFENVRSRANKKIQVIVISSQLKNDEYELYEVEWDDKVSKFIQKPIEVEILQKLLN